MAGEPLVEGQAVKTPRLRPVVGRGRPHQDLGQKQQGDDDKELDGGLLGSAGFDPGASEDAPGRRPPSSQGS